MTFKRWRYPVLKTASVLLMALLLTAQSALASPLICIDPGHGGKDPGARSGGFMIDPNSGEIIFIVDGATGTALAAGLLDGQINQFTALPNRIDSTTGNLRLHEADVNLDIALRLKALLDGEGYPNLMTRSTDEYPTLTQRVDIANNAKAAVFVSIHNNASAFNPLSMGTETYYFPGSPLGGVLANSLQKAITAQLSSYDRGIKKATFIVLNGTNMPAVLVEGAFVSNQDEVKLLLKPDYRQKMAQGILNGLKDYLSLRHYSDVPPEHWAYPVIERLTIENIVTGQPCGNFLPEYKIDRAEFARLVCKAMKWPLINPQAQSFPDVAPTHPDYSYIETAKANGVIMGYEDGSFRPTNKIIRAEIAAMVARASKLETTLVESAFTDVLPTHWALKSILSCQEKGIVKGYPDGTFKPASDITRAEITSIIFKMLPI